ncbi:ribbon-helix-helix domain-containing protein [Chelatococcus reniformis]|uniref:Ribbon-helix-helix domain-containing protein n=1 Tax=Chelatococcus reniformis TaxID=1494448 RepID=A0A916URC8_9HYPH|nr:ribbon-helix-helix domain-containing protein [Chelatococcus reniformis]GGC84103.1 hypothetical protein GCM10010994_47500 [Chelatococcus reniformis]
MTAAKGPAQAPAFRVVKRSLVVAGHRTSVSLEEPFWAALKEIAAVRRQSLAGLVAAIDDRRDGQNLSSAIRVFVLAYFRDATAFNDVTPGQRERVAGR